MPGIAASETKEAEIQLEGQERIAPASLGHYDYEPSKKIARKIHGMPDEVLTFEIKSLLLEDAWICNQAP